MFWKQEKLAQRVIELEPYRYKDHIHVERFDAIEESHSEEITKAVPQGERKPMLLGDRWEGRDKYIWLTAKVHIPENWKHETVVGVFDFGKTGGGHNSGFESLLYVNGEPLQAVDGNHKEVFFPEKVIGQSLLLEFRLWSGLEGIKGNHELQEHRLQTSFIACLDKQTDDLYYTAKAALETIEVLSEYHEKREPLLQAVDRSFIEVDWRDPGKREILPFYRNWE